MFSEKTVIITGAASGMGKLCAECFAREGAHTVLVDVNGQALDTNYIPDEILKDKNEVVLTIS